MMKKRYKILLNDGLSKGGLELFEKAGMEVDTNKRNAEELIRDISNFDALIVRSATKVTRDVLEAGKDRLKLVGRAGVGYDNVKIDGINQFHIPLMIAPHGNTISTAELAHILMGVVSRGIAQAHCSLKDGIWQKKKFKNGTETFGKTLGIIGCGRIGQKLSQLVRGYDMKVIGYDLFPNNESRIEYMEKDDVLKQADYISIHTGGEAEIIGAKEIALMKPKAYLVNVSRGPNVNEDALYEALLNNKIAGAGIDAHNNEPKKDGEKFLTKFKGLDNIVMTPHLGASTVEAQAKTGKEMAQVTIDYLIEGKWTNAIGISGEVEREKKDLYRLFITHDNKPGMLGKINTKIGEYNINIEKCPSEAKNGTAYSIPILNKPVSKKLIGELKVLEGVHYVRE